MIAAISSNSVSRIVCNCRASDMNQLQALAPRKDLNSKLLQVTYNTLQGVAICTASSFTPNMRRMADPSYKLVLETEIESLFGVLGALGQR